MYASTFFENKILNAFRGTAATAPTALYVGLFLSSPGENGISGLEVAYPGYTRMRVTFAAPTVTANGRDVSVVNSNDILFPLTNVDVGRATHIGIYTSATVGSGDMYLYGELITPLDIRANQQPSFYGGDIKYESTGNFSRAFKTKYLNILRGTALTGLTPYLTLFNGDPESSGYELAGANFARVAMTFSAPAEQTDGRAQISNTALARFPSPGGTWGLWAYNGLMDAATGGSLVLKFQNPIPETILANYIPQVNIGDYKVAVN